MDGFSCFTWSSQKDSCPAAKGEMWSLQNHDKKLTCL